MTQKSRNGPLSLQSRPDVLMIGIDVIVRPVRGELQNPRRRVDAHRAFMIRLLPDHAGMERLQETSVAAERLDCGGLDVAVANVGHEVALVRGVHLGIVGGAKSRLRLDGEDDVAGQVPRDR